MYDMVGSSISSHLESNVPEKRQVDLLALVGLKNGDSFICLRPIEDDEGPDRNSRARLPSESPGPVFFPTDFPHSNGVLPMATQEPQSFPGRELVPHLAFPTPGVAPDVDTAERCSGHYRLIHGTVSFSWYSFLLFTFLYTTSIIPIANPGSQLVSRAAVLQSRGT